MIRISAYVDSQNMQKMFFDRPNIAKMAEQGEVKYLSRFGAYVMTRARRSMRKGGKGNKTSAPGEAPRYHVGDLRKGIFGVTFRYDSIKHSVVIGAMPFKRSSNLTVSSQTVPETLEYGGRRRFIRRKRMSRYGKEFFTEPKTVNFKPRPYMNPAFKSVIDDPKNTVWLKAIL